MMDIPANAQKIDVGMVYPCGCSEKEPHMVRQVLSQINHSPVVRMVCLKHGKYCDATLEEMS